MHGLVALDASDAVIRPAILWNDGRTGAECEEIEATLGLDRLVALTGNRALPGFTAPKLLWLRHHEPESYARIAHVMLPKDYVRLRLCGERATDVADASGTLLLDVAHRAWSAEVLEALELDRAWLPRGAWSRRRARARPPTASRSRPARATRPPARSASASTARARCRWCSGTSGVVFAAQDAYGADPEGARPRVLPRDPGDVARDGRDALGRGRAGLAARRRRPRHGLRDAASPPRRAGSPGAEGLTFLPYLAGERTPHADPDARGAFAGLSLRHDRGALVRAVLEGVAYGLRDSLDLLRDVGAPAEIGRVSGGGARSDLWLQIVASVLELPLQRVAVQEGAAYGAALLGGVAGGVFADPRRPWPPACGPAR